MNEILSKIEIIGTIIMGIIVVLWFILSVISALIFKKRNGYFPNGQGYGK